MPYAQIADRMRRQDRATVLAGAGALGLAGLVAAGVRSAASRGMTGGKA